MINANWKPKPLFDTTPQPQAPPQPQGGLVAGIHNFIGNTASGIASPFAYLGRSAIVNPLRELSATVTNNKVALKNAQRDANNTLGLGEQGKNFQQGIKKWAGNSTQAFLSGGGVAAPAGGTLLAKTGAGAALGAGFGGASALAKDNSTLDDVLKQAALGAGFGGGISFLGNVVPSVLNKAARNKNGAVAISQVDNLPGSTGRVSVNFKKPIEGEVVNASKTSLNSQIEELGNNLLAKQYGTISKPVARATNPTKTIGKLADYGILKPQDAERLSQQVTGSSGIINKAVVKAVGKAGRVRTDGLMRIVDDGIENYGLVEKDAKSIRNVAVSQFRRLEGGSQGSLNGANPSDTLSAIKSIEKRIADLTGKGENYKLSTPERVDQAQVLGLLKDELTDRLYEAAGANKNIATVLTPKFRTSLLELNPGNQKWSNFVDNTVMKSKDIGELRSTMKPFVDISKIIDEGDINSMTYGGRVANNIGGIKNTIMDKVSEVAAKPVARVTGTALRSAAKGSFGESLPMLPLPSLATRGVAPVEASYFGNTLAKTLGTANSAVKNQSPNINEPGANLLTNIENMLPQLSAQNQNMSSTFNEAAPNMVDNSPFAPQNIQNTIQTVVQQGGGLKEIGQVLALAKDYQALTGSQSQLSSTAATQLASSSNAVNTLEQLQGLFSTAGGGSGRLGGSLKNVLAGAGLEGNTQTYNDLAASSVSQLARALNGGGQVSDADAAVVIQALPKITDSKEVAARKFAALKARLDAARQNTLMYGVGNTSDQLTATYAQ